MSSKRLEPDTEIPGLGGVTVGSFWAWAYSDIMTNTTRGTFAEFLVGSALGVVEDSVQSGWEGFDLKYGSKKVEVKSSAYLQSWHQEKPSKISFDIGERGSWEADTNSWIAERTRSADCYVFCVFIERDRTVADVLDTGKWDFYILSTKLINAEFGNQKSVSLSRIQRIAEPVGFSAIRERINSVLKETAQLRA